MRLFFVSEFLWSEYIAARNGVNDMIIDGLYNARNDMLIVMIYYWLMAHYEVGMIGYDMYLTDTCRDGMIYQ